MANPQLGSIDHFPTLLLSRRPGSLFTDHSPPTDLPKSGSFASSIPPSFALSRNLIITNTEQLGFVLALSYDRQLPPFRFTGRYSLATRHSPLATLRSPPEPPSAEPASSGRAQILPGWLLPATDRRNAKD